MKKGNTNGNFAVFPPENFTYIEETLCRCTLPFTVNNIAFIKTIGTGSIINISGEKLDPLLTVFCEEQGILIVRTIIFFI
jgi:hypothetical protein